MNGSNHHCMVVQNVSLVNMFRPIARAETRHSDPPGRSVDGAVRPGIGAVSGACPPLSLSGGGPARGQASLAT